MQIYECYQVLGIKPSTNKLADIRQIKKAYRRLALQHHPDKGGSDEMFKRIGNAYSELNEYLKMDEFLDPKAVPAQNSGMPNESREVSYIVVPFRGESYPGLEISYGIARHILTGHKLSPDSDNGYLRSVKVVSSRDAVNEYFSPVFNDLRMPGTTRVEQNQPLLVLEINLPESQVAKLLSDIRDVNYPDSAKVAHEVLTNHLTSAILSFNKLHDICLMGKNTDFSQMINTLNPNDNTSVEECLKDYLSNVFLDSDEMRDHPNHVDFSIYELREMGVSIFSLPSAVLVAAEPVKPVKSLPASEGFFGRFTRLLQSRNVSNAEVAAEPAVESTALSALKAELLSKPQSRGTLVTAVNVNQAFLEFRAFAGNEDSELAQLAPHLYKAIKDAVDNEKKLHEPRDGRRKGSDPIKGVYLGAYTYMQNQFNNLVQAQVNTSKAELLRSLKRHLDECYSLILRLPPEYTVAQAGRDMEAVNPVPRLTHHN